MRHRDPFCCLIGQLVIWLFWRWHIEKEPFPSFISSDDWYNIKLLPQSKNKNKIMLLYQTANSWINRLYAKTGISGSKTTHLPRVAAAMNADMQGVPDADISSRRPYSSTFPQAFIAMINMFINSPGSALFYHVFFIILRQDLVAP
jgi:hypothetical protein